ncbi:hypothetical protein FA95DRAFT_1612442 [Auriscalpium vulgare]|uniref:Uncharacterized protein n=1 Tax=Auriscalpium vulgare TaxID=40419 RepID=A0ACB8R6B0_9AGAM|nr:hypothetical protein FA95DRAFT_1612442 [Auriscalpium vulgare]
MEKSLSFVAPSIAVLELCTRVEGINLYNQAYGGAWDPVLAALLRALPLKPMFLEVTSNQESVGRAIELWSSIRALSVSAWSTSDVLPDIRMLHGFRALSVQAQDIEWLLAPGKGLVALRELNMMVPVNLWASALCRQLSASGVLPQLRVLNIKGDCPPQNILEPLTRLERLLPERHVAFPQSLRHLGFIGMLEARSTVAGLRMLPNMQRVTWFSCPPEDQLTMMKDVCRELGLELEIYLDFLVSPGPWPLDWVSRYINRPHWPSTAAAVARVGVTMSRILPSALKTAIWEVRKQTYIAYIDLR